MNKAKEKALDFLELSDNDKDYYTYCAIQKAIDIALKEQAIEYDLIIRELKKKFIKG